MPHSVPSQSTAPPQEHVVDHGGVSESFNAAFTTEATWVFEVWVVAVFVYTMGKHLDV